MDNSEFILWGSEILESGNLYERFSLDHQGYLTLKVPPVGLLIITLAVFLFGTSLFSVKAYSVFFDLIIVYLMYKNLSEVRKNKGTDPRNQDSTKVSGLYLYFFFPVSLLNWFLVPYSNITQMWLILGIFFFLKEKWGPMAVVISIGFLTEIYPIFFLVPILLQLIVNKEIKRVLYISGVFLLTCVLLCLPFILSSPKQFFHSFIVHFSRAPQGISLWEKLIPVGEDIFTFSVLGTQVGIQGIFFIGIYGALLLVTFLFLRKNPQLSKEKMLILITIHFLSFPLIFMSLFIRYILWTFPLICLIVDRSLSHRNIILKSRLVVFEFVAFSIVAIVIFSDYIFLDLRNYYESNLPDWEMHVTFLGLLILVLSQTPTWILVGSPLKIFESTERKTTVLQMLLVIQAIFVIQGLAYVFLFEYRPYPVVIHFIGFLIGAILLCRILLHLINALQSRKSIIYY